MDYKAQLKAIGEATDLRVLLDSLETQIAGKDARILSNDTEIAKREHLEEANKKLIAEREELAKALNDHRAKLDTQLADLAKVNVTLNFDAKVKPFVHS